MPDPAAFWDAIAPRYAARPFADPAATARKVDTIRAALRPTDRLLDLGCASGMMTVMYAPHVAEVHGIDVSAAMVERAEARAAGLSNVRFSVRNVGALEGIPDASVEVVTAFNLLHLVPDPAALLRGVARVLVPGGVFASATACLGGRWMPPYALMLPVLTWLGKAPEVTLLTRAELEGMFAAAGFVGVVAPEVGGRGDTVFLMARRG